MCLNPHFFPSVFYFTGKASGSCSPCLSPRTPNPTQLLFSSQCHPPAGDQVVPSLQKLSVYEHTPPCSPRRVTKPLPPLPDIGDLSSDEAEDNEVEFFSSTSESQCLVPKTPSFQYGLPGRRSFRGNGQINFAYHEGPQWEQMVTPNQDRPQRRLHRSHSGPAGSFKATNFRPTGLHHSPHTTHPQEKPEVPPRVPIRIASVKARTAGSRQPMTLMQTNPLKCCQGSPFIMSYRVPLVQKVFRFTSTG